MVVCVTASGSLEDAAAGDEWDFLIGKKASYEDVLVVGILAGDRFVLEGGEKIKLIGLEVPPLSKKEIKETKQSGLQYYERKPIVDVQIPVEEQAIAFIKDLLLNKRVRLEFDAVKRDEDFNTLAYCYINDDKNTFVNSEILRQGLARLKISPPNTKYAEKLRAAYNEGHREKRGLQGQ